MVDSNRGSTTTVNQLLINSIRRQFKNGKLECRASSSSEAPDVVREVPLTIYCKLNLTEISKKTSLVFSTPSYLKMSTKNDFLKV